MDTELMNWANMVCELLEAAGAPLFDMDTDGTLTIYGDDGEPKWVGTMTAIAQ